MRLAAPGSSHIVSPPGCEAQSWAPGYSAGHWSRLSAGEVWQLDVVSHISDWLQWLLLLVHLVLHGLEVEGDGLVLKVLESNWTTCKVFS